MRTTLFIVIIAVLRSISVGGQTTKLDYKEISAVKPPPFKGTVSYRTGAEKNAKLEINNTGPESKTIVFFEGDAETPIDESKITRQENMVSINLSEFQDNNTHGIRMEKMSKKKTVQLALFSFEPLAQQTEATAEEVTTDPAKEERADFWKRIKSAFSIDMKRHYVTTTDCCDNCSSCENDALRAVDRIIYDALTGITYFAKADLSAPFLCPFCGLKKKKAQTESVSPVLQDCFRVDNRHVIKLRANESFIFQVKNVNPALYDVELTDTSFLMFNESNPLLEKFLLGKAEGIDLQARGTEKTTEADNEEYLRVRAGLVLLNAEMTGLLENLRLQNRFLNNCITEKKQAALSTINNFVTTVLGNGNYGATSFWGFVDIFLDPGSALDSSLNRQLKNNYRNFIASKYELAYRFAKAPEHDQMLFTLKILRKESSPYPNLLNPVLPTHVAYIRNFFKVDVSSGLYYSDFFRDHNYSTRADSVKVTRPDGTVVDSSGNRLVAGRSGKGEIGFASFLHFYYKFGTTVNLGINIGAGFSFEDNPQLRYFTGLSLMLGRNNRVSINGGWIWGFQKVLSSQYSRKADGSLSWIPTAETTLKYDKQFRTNGFISFSYNLPFLKRKSPEAKTGDNPAKTDSSKK